ncbi:MoxR family ATPase [Nocardiopsis sp. CNT-189]|uniref:AAA family ATPase n=1 Tax=Nocardiopsis oceanisediminis TaxID=2816862 RepID=UPI003B3253BB
MTESTLLESGHGPGEAPPPEEAAARIGALADAIGEAVVGKDGAVRLALVALICEGHLLLEDVPGVGKTTLARAVAAVTGGTCRRIQFTPDLLPSDVTGVPVYDQETRTFGFHPGPVFGNVVIADEINRASPKTQSALLEVMEERRVTVDGTAREVPRPFLVVATQNPVEMDGTYRLPEAQLDRFLIRLSLGYPDTGAELAVMRGGALRRPEELAPVAAAGELEALRAAAERVFVHDALLDYILRIAQATRAHGEVRVGVSPRATRAFVGALRAFAAADGRGYATPEDVKGLVGPVWAHRLVLAPGAAVGGRSAEALLADLLGDVPAPDPAAAAEA